MDIPTTTETVTETVTETTPRAHAVPETDTRSYRSVRLSNGIRALVISDPSTTRCSAAIDVTVGHRDNPRRFQGMAHYLEHMCFMGSKKYPDENHFTSLLSANGGYSNAYTSHRNTNYQFEANHSVLNQALDVFAQFVIAPLFCSNSDELKAQSRDAMKREVNAVNSEHLKNIDQDVWRNDRAMKCSSETPYGYFSTGDTETLGKSDVSDLRSFFVQHYRADRIAICVVGKEHTDTLVGWVEECFAGVNPALSAPPRSSPPLPFRDDQEGVELHLIPIKDTRDLVFEWVIRPDAANPLSPGLKPGRLIAHVLGSEAPGSLLMGLKDSGMVDALDAGVSASFENFAVMSIRCALTIKGGTCYQQVLQCILDYIARLPTTETFWNRVFYECKSSAELDFRFQPLSGLLATTRTYSCNINRFTLGSATSAPYLYSTRKDIGDTGVGLIRNIVAGMTHSRARVLVVLPANAASATRSDAMNRTEVGSKHARQPATVCQSVFDIYYNMTIVVRPITRLKRSEIEVSNAVSILSTPQMRRGMRPRREKVRFYGPSGHATPRRCTHVTVTPGVATLGQQDLWWKSGGHHGQPKIAWVVLLVSPTLTTPTDEQTIRNQLSVDEANEKLDRVLYYADQCGNRHNVVLTNRGLEICVIAWTDVAELYMGHVLDTVFGDASNEQTRARVYQRARRTLSNFHASPAHSQVRDKLAQLTSFHQPSHVRLDALDRVGVADSAAERDSGSYRAFDNAHATHLVIGNLTHDIVQKCVGTFGHKANIRGAPFVPARVKQIIPGQYDICGTDRNNALLVRIAVPTDRHIVGEMLVEMLHQPFFDELRGKQQLGYIVSMCFERTGDAHGVVMTIQSEKPHTVLASAVHTFLEQAHTMMLAGDWWGGDGHPKRILDAEFESHRNALVSEKTRPYKTLLEELGHDWSELSRIRAPRFQRLSEEATLLGSVTVQNIADELGRWLLCTDRIVVRYSPEPEG